jgi:hypothetical protein
VIAICVFRPAASNESVGSGIAQFETQTPISCRDYLTDLIEPTVGGFSGT